jgi:hypothetical protein
MRNVVVETDPNYFENESQNRTLILQPIPTNSSVLMGKILYKDADGGGVTVTCGFWMAV